MKHYAAELTNRSVIKISGPDADKFLSGLFTNSNPATGEMHFAGLLTPQGKILFDFLISGTEDGFLIDIDAEHTDEFIKRLTFYKLRADAQIQDVSDEMACVAVWGAETLPDGAIKDPRHDKLGGRALILRDKLAEYFSDHQQSDMGEYHKHRISLGIPQGGLDYVYGDNFPHDACYDYVAGVDFKKGCFIGQEVVSRMKHRGTARKRMVVLESQSPLPETGTDITANGQSIGRVGSVDGQRGIGLVRLDRVGKALENELAIMAGESVIQVSIAEWADYSFESSN